MDESKLIERTTVNPGIFGGQPIIRGQRIAVEHIFGMLAAGATPQSILEHHPYLESDDILACFAYARRVVGRERVEPPVVDSAA